MGTLSGRRADLWFGKRVRSAPGTELGPDNRGNYGQVSQTGRYFTWEWWFGHHMDRDERGEWDETDAGRRRREAFGTPKGAKAQRAARAGRRESPADRQKRERAEYVAYCHDRFLAAEKATNGNMVTPAGRAKGYSGADFFDPDARRRPGRRYATDELRAWFGYSDTAAGGHGSRGGLLSATAYREHTRERKAA